MNEVQLNSTCNPREKQ